jgi:hypothetical protein
MWYLGHYCLIFQLSLLSGCCIGAPPSPSSQPAPAAGNHIVSSDDAAVIAQGEALSSAAVIAATTTTPRTAVATPAPLRRAQRSVKENDLVDYIAIQELERPLSQQSQRYVSSDPPDYLSGWQPDRLGWQLQPQVGKRPKRMRGQESARPI